MTFVFAPPAPASVPVKGSADRFPVRRIFCVGRNYEEHAKEMGADTKEPPFFFTKPADSLVTGNEAIPYPSATEDLHHEAELVVALGKGGSNVSVEAASGLIWGFAPGNDLTRRDMQAQAKQQRRPWDMSKGFDRSAVCGDIVPVADCGEMSKGRIRCTVDGAIRQDGDLADMIWDVPHVIAYLSTLVDLQPGDLIFTGTPAGVGAVVRGETVRVEIEGLGAVETKIG